MASDNKNLASQRREEGGVVYFDRGTRDGRDGKKYDRFAIQTHFVEVGEDASALLEKYVDDSKALWADHVDKLDGCLLCSVIGTHAGPGAVAVAFFRKG